MGLASPFYLGPLDQMVFRGVPIQVVFVYEMPTVGLEISELIPINLLRQALGRLLDYYPHLTGRLHFDPTTNAPEIIALGTGAELLEAHCSERLDCIASRSASGRLLITNMPGGGNDLLPSFDPSTEGVCRDPILSVKHTRFTCGGVALGVRLHHIVCDAQGFFNLVNDLAEVYRGFRSSPRPNLLHPPEIESILRGPQALSPEQRQAVQYRTGVYFANEDAKSNEPSAGTGDMPPSADFEIVGRVLRFSGEHLAAFKARASDPSHQGWVSTTDALSAYLCQTVYQARLKYLQQSRGISPAADLQSCPGFWTSIDMRGPERLALPPKYFPNCIYPAYTNSLHTSIADCPLWKVAKAVHDLVQDVNPERMQRITEWVAAQDDKSRIRVGFVFGNGSFTVSQWSKMNMYKGKGFDVDAKGERILPALVAPPFTPISLVDGLALFLATNEEVFPLATPSMDVNLSFIKPLWDILDDDGVFQKFYC